VAATEANARRNRIARRVRAAPVAAEAWTGPRVPLVLANLLAAAHVALAPAFADLVEAGGTLVAGGILAAERRTVGQALARAGFAPVDRVERQGWVSLRLRRRGGGAGARPR
jgi:ribosomal protein L11 methyltransferase